MSVFSSARSLLLKIGSQFNFCKSSKTAYRPSTQPACLNSLQPFHLVFRKGIEDDAPVVQF